MARDEHCAKFFRAIKFLRRAIFENCESTTRISADLKVTKKVISQASRGRLCSLFFFYSYERIGIEFDLKRSRECIRALSVRRNLSQLKMRFSPKLPAVHCTKRMAVRAVNEVVTQHMDNIKLPGASNLDMKRLFSSLLAIGAPFPELRQLARQVTTGNPGSKVISGFRTLRVPRGLNAKPQANPITAAPKSVAETSEVLIEFPKLVNVLPKNVKDGAVLNFPLLNPWRLCEIQEGLDETEQEFQSKRAELLAVSFPPSKFPSVSKILQSTTSDMAKENLDRWKTGMIEKLGEVGFINHQRKLFYRGSIFHKNISTQLKGTPPQTVQPEIEKLWTSLKPVFPHISEIRLLEHTITHPFLCYKGVVDCVAVYDKELVVIDWKTSGRPKPTLYDLYDEPIQAVAYVGALNYDKNLDFQVEKVTIVIAYDDGTPATVHRLSQSHCKDYWQQWLERLKLYWDSLEE